MTYYSKLSYSKLFPNADLIPSAEDPDGTGTATKYVDFLISGDNKKTDHGFTKRYIPFDSSEDYFEWVKTVPPAYRNFYEIVRGGLCKLYFDIDYTWVDTNDFNPDCIQNIIMTTIDILEIVDDGILSDPICESDFAIYCSSRLGKESYHIVLNKYCFESVAHVKEIVKQVNEIVPGVVDLAPYGISSQNFRLTGCCKKGQTNYKLPYEYQGPDLTIPINTNVMDSLITNVEGLEMYHVEMPERIENNNIQYTGDAADLIPILDGIPNKSDYDTWLKVGMALKTIFPNDTGLTLWKDFSKQALNYNSHICEQKYDTFNYQGSLGIGTLHYLSNYVSKVEFDEADIASVERIPKTEIAISKGSFSISHILETIKEFNTLETDSKKARYNYYVSLLNKYIRKYIYRCSAWDGFFMVEDGKFIFYNNKSINNYLRTGITMKLNKDKKYNLKHQYDLLEIDYKPVFAIGKDSIFIKNNIHCINIAPELNIDINGERGTCELIKQHLYKVFCSSNDVEYNYLIQWIARALLPKTKNTTGLIIAGDQGSGKTTLSEIITGILGNDLCSEIQGIDNATSRFNKPFSCKKFISLEEVSSDAKTFHKFANRMKTLITATKIEIEEKGKDRHTEKSMLSICLMTNDINPVKIESRDRRYYIPTIADTYIDDKKYFDALYDEIHTESSLCEFYHYCASLYDSKINMNMTIPQTKAKQESVVDNLPGPISFILDTYILAERHFNNNIEILFNNYVGYCDRSNMRAYSKRIFMQHIRTYGFTTKQIRSPNGRYMGLVENREAIYDLFIKKHVLKHSEKVKRTIIDEIDTEI